MERIMQSEINFEVYKNDYLPLGITGEHKVSSESIISQLEKTSIEHHFKEHLFPHSIGMSQKSILAQYKGKPLSDHNLEEINDILIHSKVTPSKELAKIIESIGLKTQLFPKETQTKTPAIPNKHSNTLDHYLILEQEKKESKEKESQILLTLNNLHKLKNILGLYDLHHFSDQQLNTVIDHLVASEIIRIK